MIPKTTVVILLLPNSVNRHYHLMKIDLQYAANHLDNNCRETNDRNKLLREKICCRRNWDCALRTQKRPVRPNRKQTATLYILQPSIFCRLVILLTLKSLKAFYALFSKGSEGNMDEFSANSYIKLLILFLSQSLENPGKIYIIESS